MALSLQRRDQKNAELIREQFVAAWARTDEIFAIVSEQDIFARPIVWRHPLIFYVGHLPAFAWNQVCGALLNWQSCNPCFDDLFCRGIDPMSIRGSAIGIPMCLMNGRVWRLLWITGTKRGALFCSQSKRSLSAERLRSWRRAGGFFK